MQCDFLYQFSFLDTRVNVVYVDVIVPVVLQIYFPSSTININVTPCSTVKYSTTMSRIPARKIRTLTHTETDTHTLITHIQTDRHT